MRQLVYQICYTRYYASFYLWLIGSVLKHCKVPKYHDHYCRYYFFFRCYLHHNCSINLNWNNKQLYSSPKPLRNVPSSVFWFVKFCFLPFLRRTSIQKWKEIWFCYVRKWVGKKEMSAKISKRLCRNLFIGVATQIRAVHKDREIVRTLKK